MMSQKDFRKKEGFELAKRGSVHPLSDCDGRGDGHLSDSAYLSCGMIELARAELPLKYELANRR